MIAKCVPVYRVEQIAKQTVQYQLLLILFRRFKVLPGNNVENFRQLPVAFYNQRARRKNPNLEGKIILEVTIAPSGKVTKIRVASSELDDKKLGDSIVKRIKAFDFVTQKVEAVTVTYPIDFLPS